jgi:hypothetical protein
MECIIKANLADPPVRSIESIIDEGDAAYEFPVVVPLNVSDDNPRVLQFYMNKPNEV